MRKRVKKREGALEQERHIKVLLDLSIVNKSLFSDVWHLSIFTTENRKRLYKITAKNMKLAEVRVVFLFRLIIGFFFFPLFFLLQFFFSLFVTNRNSHDLTNFVSEIHAFIVSYHSLLMLFSGPETSAKFRLSQWGPQKIRSEGL